MTSVLHSASIMCFLILTGAEMITTERMIKADNYTQDGKTEEEVKNAAQSAKPGGQRNTPAERWDPRVQIHSRHKVYVMRITTGLTIG